MTTKQLTIDVIRSILKVQAEKIRTKTTVHPRSQTMAMLLVEEKA
jgi:hypothetical protein